ncbi:MAG: sigma-70 family RNA polymerase sigma factor [Nitrospira sp.]|nr:sigma-70 family RNA polymerase sigma factor [Nitrospira sp.]
MSTRELSYLKDHLKGPILRIKDPSEHSVEDILKSYFREILVIARKYTRPTVEFEDLVVEGLMGLLDAIRRWDSEKSKGNEKAFHNLAIVRIKSNMFEYFLSNNTMYYIPSYMGRAMSLVEQIRNLVNAFEYPGDSNQALLNFNDEAFEEHVPADHSRKVRSLKEKVRNLAQGFDRTYEQMILAVLKVERDIESFEQVEGEPEFNPEELVAQREYLEKILMVLKPDARDVLISLMEGETLEQAGEKKGFTRERARQIREETLDFLKKTPYYKDATEK